MTFTFSSCISVNKADLTFLCLHCVLRLSLCDFLKSLWTCVFFPPMLELFIGLICSGWVTFLRAAYLQMNSAPPFSLINSGKDTVNTVLLLQRAVTRAACLLTFNKCSLKILRALRQKGGEATAEYSCKHGRRLPGGDLIPFIWLRLYREPTVTKLRFPSFFLIYQPFLLGFSFSFPNRRLLPCHDTIQLPAFLPLLAPQRPDNGTGGG